MKAAAILILLASLILAPSWAQAEPGVLTIAGRAEVTGDAVTLLDLAENSAELNQDVTDRLAAVTIMAAPALGRQKRTTGTRLRTFIRQAGLPRDLTIYIPATVNIVRSARKISADELAAIFEDELRDRLKDGADDIEIHSIRAGNGLTLPAGRLTTRVRLTSRRMEGRVQGRIQVMVDGARVAQVRASATVDRYGDVVVTLKPLSRGRVLDAEDLQVQRRRLTSIKGPVARSIADVEGLRTKSSISMGSPLKLGRLERAPLIKRGEVVTMLCQSGNIKITAKGEALETGYKGGRIKLTNLGSKRKVYGKVLDSATVLVEF